MLRSHRWRTAENSAGYLLPHLTSAARLLDVGCGPGTITADLAARAGEVVAIDAAEDILGQARAEADQRGQANVTFQPGDVYHLDFPDGSFDVVHAHQVLQHLSDP
ncbi:MAG: class I SAM-dependent methyltransferase, partial [Streptosporangiaceae bacterium]